MSLVILRTKLSFPMLCLIKELTFGLHAAISILFPGLMNILVSVLIVFGLVFAIVPVVEFSFDLTITFQ